MSKSVKAILAVLLIASVSIVLLQNHSLTALESAMASETPPAQIDNTAAQEQLHQLLLERKSLLESIADTEKLSLEYGRGSVREYCQAKKAALLAGIDLCTTKAERVEILKKIVQLHDNIDRQNEMEAAAGQIGQSGLARARADRLESEIDLLREQLK